MKDFTQKPNKEKEPYTYHKYKKLGILNSEPVERLLMYELYTVFATDTWLNQRDESLWDTEDMRAFVKDIVPRIKDILQDK